MRSAFLISLFLVSNAWADGFKNLQVLPPTTTKEQIKEIMKAQSKALGVDCDECHEVPDMASDKLEMKKIAREMMKMQQEINNRWLKGMKIEEKHKVTCGTCHRGQESPPAFVPAQRK